MMTADDHSSNPQPSGDSEGTAKGSAERESPKPVVSSPPAEAPPPPALQPTGGPPRDLPAAIGQVPGAQPQERPRDAMGSAKSSDRHPALNLPPAPASEPPRSILERKVDYLTAQWAIEAHGSAKKFELKEQINAARRDLVDLFQVELNSASDRSSETLQKTIDDLQRLISATSKDPDARPSLLKPLLVETRPLRFELVDEFNRRWDDLEQHRVLLINADHRDVLLDLELRVARRLTDHAKLVLGSRENYLGNGDPVTFDDVWDWHLEAAAASPPLLTFVHIAEQPLKNSTEKFFSRPDFATQHAGRLRAQNGYIVCLLFASAVDDRRLAAESLVWEVAWLEPVLRALAPSSDEAEALIKQLQAQRQQDLWPQDDRTFGKEVSKYLHPGGYRALKEEMESRAAEPQGKGRLIDLGAAGHVQRAVVFTGLAFPGISVPGLATVMRELLKGETQELVHNERKPEGAGLMSEKLARRSVDAGVYWQNHQDDVVYECGLRRYTDADGRAFLDFDSRQRQQYQKAFSERLSMFHFRQVERLYRSGLLYETDLPREVVSQLTELTATMAQETPDVYGASWLLKTLDLAQQPGPNEFDVATDTEQFVQRFFHWLAEKASVFYPRFGLLCGKLLRTEKTHNEVERLLQYLITARSDGQAPKLAWRLVRQLRDAPKFDYPKWIRRIWNGAPGNVRLGVLQDLLDDAMESDRNFETIGNQLCAWLPEWSSECREVAERYAAGFIFEYFRASSDACLRSLGGQRGFQRHPAFPPPTESDSSVDARVSWLARWLLQPALSLGVGLIMRDYLREGSFSGLPDDDVAWGKLENQIDVAAIAADVVEGWMELAELLKDEPACNACRSLVVALLNEAELQQRKKAICQGMRNRWNAKAIYYLHLLKYPESRAARESLRGKDRRVRALLKELRR